MVLNCPRTRQDTFRFSHFVKKQHKEKLVALVFPLCKFVRYIFLPCESHFLFNTSKKTTCGEISILEIIMHLSPRTVSGQTQLLQSTLRPPLLRISFPSHCSQPIWPYKQQQCNYGQKQIVFYFSSFVLQNRLPADFHWNLTFKISSRVSQHAPATSQIAQAGKISENSQSLRSRIKRLKYHIRHGLKLPA